MNIGAGNSYPANALSNFAPHPFELDGVKINSMEGFLQSLKFKESPIQESVCLLVGRMAKARGKKKNWYVKQTLYWKEVAYPRHSQEYQDLLDRAYRAMFEQSDSFRRALIAAKGCSFTHTIGNTDPNRTILTQSEFCRRITKLCKEINA